MEMEKRTQTGELRVEEKTKKIVGLAAVFNKRSQDLGGFVEIIQPGAFRKAIESQSDVRALWNHDSNFVLGRTLSGTLTLKETDDGLEVEIVPPETNLARDLLESINRGDVSQMSFAFMVREGGQKFTEEEDGTIIRTLTDLDLYEVSPVAFPAYQDTSVAMRAIQKMNRYNASAIKAKMKLGLHNRTF